MAKIMSCDFSLGGSRGRVDLYLLGIYFPGVVQDVNTFANEPALGAIVLGHPSSGKPAGLQVPRTEKSVRLPRDIGRDGQREE